MKKKMYQKPTMQVVMLKQQPQLLAGSSSAESAARQEFGNGGENTW